MAFSDLSGFGAGGSTGNNQASLTIVSSATVNAGDLMIVCVTVDNRTSGGGDDLSTSGVTVGGQALTKGRQVATNLAAQAGASVSLWYGMATAQIASGSNIVASFTTNSTSDATALSARRFSTDTRLVAVEGTNAGTSTTATPGSLDVTTANHEALRIRAIGCELDASQALTGTSTWTTWAEGASSSAGTTTEQVIEVEHLISTGTGGASNPSLGTACDNASVYVAFEEHFLMGQQLL